MKIPWKDRQEVKDAITAHNWATLNRKHRSEGYKHFLDLGKQRGKNYSVRSFESWRAKARSTARNKELLEKLSTVDLTERVRVELMGGPRTIEELSVIVDRSEVTVRAILEELKSSGFEVVLAEETAILDRGLAATDWEIDLTPFYGESLKIGVMSCTHFGSLWHQLKELVSFYRLCEREKVQVMVHAGDLVDGINMYTGQEFELYAHGLDAQREDAIVNYPESDIPTKIMGGNHDHSFQKTAGANIIKQICEKRLDLEYVGMISATFKVVDSDFEMNLIHKSGGVPYARSYAAQKIIRDMPPDKARPLLGIGGMHVTDYIPYRDQHTFTIPCFQGQTPYLKGKGLFPEVGGWIVEVYLADDGKIHRCKMEIICFDTTLKPIGREVVR